MPIKALPDVARGHLVLDGCAEVETVHESAIVQVILWHCLHEGDALQSERCHTHHVLSVSLDGACQLHDGRRRFIVDPATAVLHRPGSAYRTTHPYGCCDSGMNIAFRADVVDDAETFARRPADAPAVTVAMRPMRLALAQLVLALRCRSGLDVDPVAMDEMSLELLGAAMGSPRLASRATRADTRADHRNIADLAREYLNTHFREAVRLEDVARAVGASPFHLARVFRHHTGLALRGYIQRLRLGAAVHALADSEESITRIALDSGFASHAHLTALFGRELGVAPSELRGLLGGGRRDVSRSPLFASSPAALHRP